VWARVWPAAKPAVSRNLRQGAWYPVLQGGESAKVVLDIGGRSVAVPRRLLEIREGGLRPDFFVVVYRTRKDFERTRIAKGNLGRAYAVCPRCSGRQCLCSHEVEAECPRCQFLGQVGWWEIEGLSGNPAWQRRCRIPVTPPVFLLQ
jgi:hypothetical protein